MSTREWRGARVLIGAALLIAVWGSPDRVAAATDEAEDEVAEDVWDRVEHHRADSAGVTIHYAALGRGPLVVMIHGFPDFWYTWRDQMQALADAGFRTVAVDQRGYNESDQPKGVESYAMPRLMDDVASVLAAERAPSAIVVGHDWGGAVAWSLAMQRPELVEMLVILNLPHPAGIAREIAANPAQKRASEYAFEFQRPDAHHRLDATSLAQWVADPAARARYVAAFERSSFEAMLNYYRANYPRRDADASAPEPLPKVQAPVLMFHGLDDQALLPGALNGTWQWLEQDLTLVTIPGAGHFVHQDASEFVSETIVDWLRRH